MYGSLCCLSENVRQTLQDQIESLIASVIQAHSSILLRPKWALLCKIKTAQYLKLSEMTILLFPFKTIPLQTLNSSLKLKYECIMYCLRALGRRFWRTIVDMFNQQLHDLVL